MKPSKGRRWFKRSFYTVLALAVIGGGLYGGWRWTQTQYFVGANGEHVALYRGISQDLAWVSLSKVEKDHPDIELKYLPPYQQKQVKATIAEGGLQDAQKKIDDLAVQASACKKEAERDSATKKPAYTTGTTSTSLTSKATPKPTPSATTSTSPTPSATPSPGPSLSEEEQQVVSQCSK